MGLTQDKIRWLARLMMVLVLFAHGVASANACSTPAAGPAQAFTAFVHGDETVPCHDEEVSNANVCLAHCTQGDQVGADQHMLQLAVPVSVIGWASSQLQLSASSQVVDSSYLALDTGPPIPIRFCSLLN